MNISVLDSAGGTLAVTTDVAGTSFDATACSPHPDGFTQLNAIVGDRISLDQLERACQQSVSRGEVCILPVFASTITRVMIVPNAGALDDTGRRKAKTLMTDLFRASQADGVSARSLLITHFGYVQRYPQLHVLGIFDAFGELRRQSFLGLKVLGFQVADSVRARFERDLREAFSGIR